MPLENVRNAPLWKTPSTLDQAAPVQNTWYTVLDTKNNVRIVTFCASVETTDETLEARITIDGEVYDYSWAAGAGTLYYAGMVVTTSSSAFIMSSTLSTARTYMLEGRSIKVELRKTTATGAGNLKGVVAYQDL